MNEIKQMNFQFSSFSIIFFHQLDEDFKTFSSNDLISEFSHFSVAHVALILFGV